MYIIATTPTQTWSKTSYRKRTISVQLYHVFSRTYQLGRSLGTIWSRWNFLQRPSRWLARWDDSSTGKNVQSHERKFQMHLLFWHAEKIVLSCLGSPLPSLSNSKTVVVHVLGMTMIDFVAFSRELTRSKVQPPICSVNRCAKQLQIWNVVQPQHTIWKKE